MSEKLPLWDLYVLRARLLPCVIVLLPLGLAFLALVTPSSLKLYAPAVAAVLVVASGLLGELGRDRGKQLERELVQKWGTMPTIKLLRHREIHVNPHTRERFHTTLAQVVPGIVIPTEAEELEMPEAADTVYQSLCDWLRERTRDRETFPLVFAENVSYGFRRNLLAMKDVGILLSMLALVVTGSQVVQVGDGDARFPSAALAFGTSAFVFAFWLIRANERWVESAAHSYAERLLGAAELMTPSPMQRAATNDSSGRPPTR